MNRVVHFEVQADDIERAKTFYQKTFNWKIEKWMNKEDRGGMDYWGLVTGEEGASGINGGLYQRPPDGEKYYLYDCTIDVPDLDQAIEAVKANGGTITREKVEMPTVGWFASAKDTEGNRFGMMQAVRKQAEQML
jgi:predicted enzyme related to lactoylglutathione lyase